MRDEWVFVVVVGGYLLVVLCVRPMAVLHHSLLPPPLRVVDCEPVVAVRGGLLGLLLVVVVGFVVIVVSSFESRPLLPSMASKSIAVSPSGKEMSNRPEFPRVFFGGCRCLWWFDCCSLHWWNSRYVPKKAWMQMSLHKRASHTFHGFVERRGFLGKQKTIDANRQTRPRISESS